MDADLSTVAPAAVASGKKRKPTAAKGAVKKAKNAANKSDD